MGDVLDIFDIEGVLLKHTNGHDIEIMGGLSHQTPDSFISGVDSLTYWVGSYTRIPSLNRFSTLAILSMLVLGMSLTLIS